jgi:hypothetical protein
MEFGIMGKGQSKSPAAVGAGFNLAAFLLRPQNRGWVTTTAVLIASIVAFVVAWQKWGPQSLEGDDYLVTADKIVVTPQPDWIHSNVKADCAQSLAGLRLALLEPDLVEKVASAFAMHPWVAKVVRVEKRYPAQVHVALEYRRPVLAVKLDAPGDEGLLFLDEQAVLLPSADFEPSQARNFLRIAAAGETPNGVYGVPWNSERIAGAAALADCLETKWQPLGLYWITATRIGSGALIYELRSQDDKLRLTWGHSPGHETPGEASPAQKLATLDKLKRDNTPAESKTIDLRQP